MVRATEDVAAHPPLLRGGEERARAGGGAGQEGLAIQTPGKKLFMSGITADFVKQADLNVWAN